MSDDLDLPQVYKFHVFACFQQRPPQHPRGSCAQAGAQPLWQRLQQRMDGKPGMTMTATGCLGFCRAGPLMVVYPQGVWYAPRTPEDIDAIVDEHLLRGRIVERLAILPQP